MTTEQLNSQAVLERFAKKLSKTDPAQTYQPGDLFQINPSFGENRDRAGWVGAIIVATEIKNWGIIGFHHQIHDQMTRGKAWTRLEWSVIDFVGTARDIDTTFDYGVEDESNPNDGNGG